MIEGVARIRPLPGPENRKKIAAQLAAIARVESYRAQKRSTNAAIAAEKAAARRAAAGTGEADADAEVRVSPHEFRKALDAQTDITLRMNEQERETFSRMLRRYMQHEISAREWHAYIRPLRENHGR
jgi:hypothetical protein